MDGAVGLSFDDARPKDGSPSQGISFDDARPDADMDAAKPSVQSAATPSQPDQIASPQPPKEHGIVANVGAGTSEATAGILGAPVDLATWAINKGSGLINSVTGSDIKPIVNPAFGSTDIERTLMADLGANPENVQASTPSERIARAVGSGAASMAIPGAGAEAMLAKTWAEGDSLGNTALQILKGSGTGSNIAIGGASGFGSEVASEAAPDRYKGIAGMAGGFAGGGLIAGGLAAAEGIGAVAKHAWQAVAEPAEVRAARIILSKATDQDAFKQALNDHMEAPPLLDGSEPTTFQATGDLGVGAYERGVAASPSGVAAFAARREEQNAARLDALNSLADPQADPHAVSDFIKTRLQDITTDHAAKVASASDDLADSLTKTGGTNFDNASAYGDAIRVPLSILHQQMKSETNALWRAIDPDMTAEVNVMPLKQATADLMDTIPGIAKQPNGEEQEILAGIGNLGRTATFGDMVALRTRLTDAIRAERGSPTGSPTITRRLAMTLDNVDDTLAKTAGDIASYPDQREAMVDRLEANLVAERDSFQARQQNGQREATGGTNAGEGNTGNAPIGQGDVSAGTGNEGAGGREPPLSTGNQSLSPPAGIPDDVAARYAAARTGTLTTKSIYENGPVGSVIRPGPQFGSFSMMPSNVPKNLFDKPEALMAFTKAAIDSPDLMDQMQDYAAFSLRNAAVKDGTLDPAKYQKWVDTHGYAFRQFPELLPKFASVNDAQTALDNALANQKSALTEFQNGAARHLLGDQDPVQAVGKALSNPTAFSQLGNLARNNPAALAGMKRATIDYMLGKTLSTAEAGTSGQPLIKADALQKFINANMPSLSTLFNGQELHSLTAVAADLQRANRSIVAAKIPGGSNTAQDTAAMSGHAMSALERILWHAVGTVGGTIAGHPILGFTVGTAGAAMRAARMDSVRDAITEMMLDPKKAAAGIARVPANDAESAGSNFAARMRALTANEITTARMRSSNSGTK